MSKLMSRLIDERRSTVYAIVLGVWGMSAIYAVLHDQYIVRIAPEHFTEYHRPLFNIEEPKTLALTYGFLASIAPGLLLGIACAFVARSQPFSKPLVKVSVRYILLGCFIVIIATETISAFTGYWVYKTGNPLYFASWYPDPSLPMLITQTIQLSSYFFSAVFSLLLLIAIGFRRYSADMKLA